MRVCSPSAQRCHVRAIGDCRRHLSVDQLIAELKLALAECRAHIARGNKDNQSLEHVAEAASKIERVLELLKSIR